MADYEIHGNQGVILTDPGVLTTDLTGFASCTAIFTTPVANYSALPGVGSPHPIFSFMGMDSRDLALKNQFAVATCHYGGLDDSSSFSSRTPAYELKFGVQDAPIDTHPRFDRFAGSPSNPLNGAVFRSVNPDTEGLTATKSHPSTTGDANYVFKEFEIFAGDTLNRFAKIESYLEASCVTWSKTVTTRVPTSELRNIGAIDNPDGPAPKLPNGYDWLFMGISMTRKGAAYISTYEWRASGRRGWNKDIYQTV